MQPTQIQTGELKLWRITDSEIHLVSAPDQESALKVYREELGDDDDPEITPVHKDLEITLIDEPGQPKILASEVMRDGVTGVISSTAY